MPESERLYVELAYAALHLDHQLRRLPPEQRSQMESRRVDDTDEHLRTLARSMRNISELIDEAMESIVQGD